MNSIFLVFILLTATPKIPCVLIKPFIAAYGKEAVIAWAKSRGYSDIQIVEVTKRCEKKGNKK